MIRKKLILTFLCNILVFSVWEIFLHINLFKYVSYSNSESIDAQIRDRNAYSDWNTIFIGDSETRWGINPIIFDEVMAKNRIEVKSFNHAFDGFGISWWPKILPSLLKEPSLRNVKIVIAGVQLIDSHREIKDTGEDCGSFQRPVLTSPFAIDLGIDAICQDSSWDARMGKFLFSPFWTVAYKSSVRSFLLPQIIFNENVLKHNSKRIGDPIRGFQPHRSIASFDPEDFKGEFSRWKAQYNLERDFIPLQLNIWDNLTHANGFFDNLLYTVYTSKAQLILYALPTNPILIDTFNRRNDYKRNSDLLKKWAKARGIIFVDLGIQDKVDNSEYYSDMRHLSLLGAEKFSYDLAREISQAYNMQTNYGKR